MAMQQSWVSRNNRYIIRHLDNTIKAVGEATFDRLAKTRNGPAWYPMNGAFLQLRRLIDDEMPIYDDWSALFYLLWYQPKQINVAYRAINGKRRGKRLINASILHLIDFGCGALAMQFGIALSIADAIDRGDPVPTVRVDSIDECDAMINLGRNVWQTFMDSLAENPRMATLTQACGLIDWHTNNAETTEEFVRAIPRQIGAEVWLSALHTVYDENIKDVRDSLAEIVRHHGPDFGFITSIRRKEELVHQDWQPFQDHGYRMIRLDPRDLFEGIEGELPETTEYRRSFERRYNQRDQRLWETTIALLNGVVDCQPQPAHYLVCTKT